ncbi:unnamed protein product [Adineta ricciae]|uniref:RING-type domain-containing protein n=1 Tax=Adineta ricciae TaxID=249248 RepID=A0A815DJ28_ADIRI|nr:unnamed protein product [Adineta ricciae]CAF1420701.1 unnamed protein product [Adineta ricciae]
MTVLMDQYEYLNEDAIDDQFKCVICIQPFRSPTILHCQHIFCQKCIETWVESNKSCPVCRQSAEISVIKIDETLNKQLDEFLVRCLRCKKTNIQRSRFAKHYQHCSKRRLQTVSDLFKTRWDCLRSSVRSRCRKKTNQTSNLDFPTPQLQFHYSRSPSPIQQTYSPSPNTQPLYRNSQPRGLIRKEIGFYAFIVILVLLLVIIEQLSTTFFRRLAITFGIIFLFYYMMK